MTKSQIPDKTPTFPLYTVKLSAVAHRPVDPSGMERQRSRVSEALEQRPVENNHDQLDFIRVK